jgi:hypothetical protein
LSTLYAALRAGDVPEDKAAAAAEEAVTYENRFAKIDTDLTEMRGKMNLLTWMVGANSAFVLAIFTRLFLH